MALLPPLSSAAAAGPWPSASSRLVGLPPPARAHPRAPGSWPHVPGPVPLLRRAACTPPTPLRPEVPLGVAPELSSPPPLRLAPPRGRLAGSASTTARHPHLGTPSSADPLSATGFAHASPPLEPHRFVKIQLGGQIRRTRPGQPQGSLNPAWNEEFMFVAGEPFDEPLVVTVEERVGPGRDEPVDYVIIPVATPLVPRNDEAATDTMEKKESKMFASKIHLRRLSMETAYHVLDESTHCSSDMQLSAKKLRKGAIVGE